jgi:hypothetical protein
LFLHEEDPLDHNLEYNPEGEYEEFIIIDEKKLYSTRIVRMYGDWAYTITWSPPLWFDEKDYEPNWERILKRYQKFGR